MEYSAWHRYDYSLGRQFYNHKDIYIKHDQSEVIKDRICEIIKEIILIESAVRITTDTTQCESERVIIAVPYEPPAEKIIRNFSDLLLTNFMAYYHNGNHKTEHFGIANEVLEGRLNTFAIREIEKLFDQTKDRNDIAGKWLRDANFPKTNVKSPGDNYMRSVLIEGVDITLGYRIVLYGNKVHSKSMFIPIPDGADVIEQIYYNIEHIIHHNFVTYDENNPRDYLKVTDTLIFKELVGLMKRAKDKEIVRKKILNNTKFKTILNDDSSALYGKLVGDTVYDTLNHVDDPVIREASDRSRELFNSFMIRSTEITQNTIDISKVEMSTTGSTYDPTAPSITSGSDSSADNNTATVSASGRRAGSSKKATKASADDLIEL